MRQSFYKWLVGVALWAISITTIEAQTEVVRYDATAETNYGIVYSLPKTEINLRVDIVEQTYTPGPLAAYANKYLSLSPELKTQTQYSITNVRPELIGVPNTDAQYLVVFDKKTIAPFVKLSQGNLLYSINGNDNPPSTSEPKAEQVSQPDRAMPSLPREYALAGSLGKQAEIAASYLYELRESLMTIIKGEAENMPKDGEAMRIAIEMLRREEARTLRLFVGDTIRREREQLFRILPEGDDMHGRVLCRFSPTKGLLPADDQAGSPLTYNLIVIDRAPALSEKELAKRNKPEGIVYNLPGTAELTLSLDGKVYVKERLPLTQLGTTQVLSRKMFNIKDGNNTSVYFDLRTGAILNIKQDGQQ